jgi:hypothetical protein
MEERIVKKFRKINPALKLIFGGNEQALILTDLLEAYAYRCSEEWIQRYGNIGITGDGFFAKSRTLIMEDTGVLTASVKNAITGLEKEGFILKTSLRNLPGYRDKVLHYIINDDVLPYIQKADDYLNKKNHRPDDRETVKKILLPFINELTNYNGSIIEALKLGNGSIRKLWKRE